MDSLNKTMYSKGKHVINLKPYPMLLDAGDLVLLLNLQRPWALVCILENGPFLLKFSTYRVINRTEICKFS